MRHNTYGVKGDSLGVGSATLAGYFRDLAFERNVLAGGKASQYPAGNFFPTTDEFAAAFVNAGAGNFALVAGSQFRNAASDGSALGADLSQLNRVATGGAVAAPIAAPAAPATPAVEFEKPWFDAIAF
jgi:hypothetical protein